ncbi:MAG: glycine--tRNA ligase subunit alpha [Bacillota bacterium]|jgi:glycyl-tRNA synthetase alpha chain
MLSFQQLVSTLQQFWVDQGCALSFPYDIETGAGTLNPRTMLLALEGKSWRTAYVEPSRRPADGRYGENPNRLYQHHQFQVLIKPSPADIQDLYLASLTKLGLNLAEHDIRFVESNWSNPTFGSAGLGWEVWLDGMEITQFTYFQQLAGFDLRPIAVELTYGLERLACYLQGVTSVFQLVWQDGVTYQDLFQRGEYEQSKYAFELADVEMLRNLFKLYENEAERILQEHTAVVAYDYLLKCSHTFNLLEARGSLGNMERISYMGRLRRLMQKCALVYLAKESADVDV